MYESPIEIMYGKMKMQVVDNVVKAVQEQQIHVDREELIKALRGERNQYQKGFNDAAREIFDEVIDKISFRYLNDVDYSFGDMIYDLNELKNKYIGGVGE